MNKIKLQSFDTLKYILALCVLIGHAFINLYPNTIMSHIEAYAVDGFFLISGFFLAKSCQKLSTQPHTPYTTLKTSIYNRYTRLAPEMIFGAILTAFIGFIIMSKPIDWGVLPFNVFFIADINKIPSLFLGMWYISVLFWLSGIFSAIYFLQKDKDKFKYIILPSIILITLLIIAPCTKHLVMHGNTFTISKIFSDGWFKGILELALGMETFFIASSLQEKKIKIKHAYFWEILGILLILHPMLSRGLHITDFMLLPGYIILIILLYLNQERLLKFLSWKSFAKITSCSYMLFILNVVILQSIKHIGGYEKYPVWLTSIAIIIGSTIIALLAQKLCAKTIQLLKKLWNLINNIKTEKILRIILYTLTTIWIFVSYNNHIININMNNNPKQTSALNINTGNKITKNFNVLLFKKLNNIKCRFFTWKNTYDPNKQINFRILNTDTNTEIMSNSVKLSSIKDNNILELKTNINLTHGNYSFIIQSDKTEQPFAISVIKTQKNGNYYINNIKATSTNDIQCTLGN